MYSPHINPLQPLTDHVEVGVPVVKSLRTDLDEDPHDEYLKSKKKRGSEGSDSTISGEAARRVVKHWMHPQVVSVSPGCTLGELAEVLSVNHISGVPVVEDGRLVGVVSQSDIARHLSQLHHEEARPSSGYYEGMFLHSSSGFSDPALKGILDNGTVREILTHHTYFVGPEASVQEIIDLMLKHHIHRVPVVSDGALVGVVTTMDILRVFQSLLAE